MEIKTKYEIGDIVHLFGWRDWPCVVTAITVRASGAVEYQLEWNSDGNTRSEWFEENRLALLGKLSADESARNV